MSNYSSIPDDPERSLPKQVPAYVKNNTIVTFGLKLTYANVIEKEA